MPTWTQNKNWESRLRRCAICSYIYESDCEPIRHIQLKHPGVRYASEIEHIILCHLDRCPFCEYSEVYPSYPKKVKHMHSFHP
jgi:hypothetical protein